MTKQLKAEASSKDEAYIRAKEIIDKKFEYCYIWDTELKHGYIWEFMEQDKISDGIENLFN